MLQAIFGPKSFEVLDYASLGTPTGGVDITSYIASEFAVLSQSSQSPLSSSSFAGLYGMYARMAAV